LDALPVEIRKTGQNILDPNDLPEGGDKFKYLLLSHQVIHTINGRSNQYQSGISIIELLNIILEWLHDNFLDRILVAKQSYGIICGLLQIPEGYNVSLRFLFIQNSVRSGICLDKAMVLEVFIYKKCVECLTVKAGQKHIDNQQQIYFSMLDPLRNIVV